MPAFDTATCSGVLAITGVSGFTMESRTVNGVRFLRMTEADTVFNAGIDCFLGGDRRNYEEVLTHELGHLIGLGHSCGDAFTPACVPGTEADDALMRAFAHGGGHGGTPRASDVDGARFIYPPAGFVDAKLNAASFTPGQQLRLTADFNGTATGRGLPDRGGPRPRRHRPLPERQLAGLRRGRLLVRAVTSHVVIIRSAWATVARACALFAPWGSTPSSPSR